MASGFSGGGPEFYSGIGRSIANLNNTNNNHHPSSQPPFRTTTPPPTNSHHHHLSQIYLDPPSQIPHQRPSPANLTPSTLIGKRTLADFQAHHQTGVNPAALNGLLLRSVKPRMYNPQQYAPTLSSMEFPAAALSSSQRYGVPLLQQLIRHHHPINLGSAGPTLQGVPYVNQNNRGGGGGGAVESENKMMNRLQELEKQLLEDDNEEDENDAVSVITTAHSEWSDTIHNLIVAPNSSSSNPISPSPTSSSTSTSASPPVSNCSRQTLLDAAAAISEGKNDVAAEILTRASQVSNPRGNSEQRLMEYMSMALKSRVNSAENPPPVTDMYGEEHFGSTQLLYEVSPCFKLGFVAANLAILEATLGQKPAGVNGFHVIDFDVGHGGQYVDLLHALSERGKPAAIKITAVVDNGAEEKDRLKVIRDKLNQFAGRLVGVSLSFNIVSCKVGDLTRESLGCEPNEPLAVNFAFKLFRMADESVSMENPRDELLRRVKGLAPRVVTLVEQELSTNTAPFMARVNESCAYYAALFDSIDSTGPSDSGERVKVETGLGRKLANSVACEGRDRTERCEVFGKWRARFSMAGFELKPLSQNVTELVKSRLSSVNSGFTVKEDNGGVCLGWMGKTLTVASAWR